LVDHQVPDTLSDQVLTPFSTLAALLAAHLAEAGVPPQDARAQAVARIESIFHFGLNTVPIVCREEPAVGFNDPARAGLLLAGLSHMGVNEYGPANALEVLRLVYEDLEVDGVLDGKGAAGRQLRLNGVDLDANVLRATLGRAVVRFLESPHNMTGLSALNPSVRAWLDQVAMNVDPIFDPLQEPWPVDVEDPEVTVESHTANQWVAGTVQFVARATDNDQLAELVIVNPQGAIYNVDFSNPREWILSWSWNTGSEPDGQVEIQLRAKDRSGNLWSPTHYLRIDNTAPAVTWSSPQDGATIKTAAGQIACTGTVSDSGVGLASVTINGRTASVNGGSFSVQVPVAEGLNTLTLVARDNLGNERTVVRTVTVITDVTAPVITFTSHTNNQYDNGTFDIVVQAVDEREIAEFVITSPDLTASVTSNPTRIALTISDFDSTAYPDGPFQIHYRAEDWAGNETTGVLTINIDNTGPSVVWISPAEGEEIRESVRIVYCSGTVSDAGVGTISSVRVQSVTANVSSGQWNTMHTNVSDGLHTYTLVARDSLGNQTTLYRTFRFRLIGEGK
ncbi:MAG: hypothetical protein ABIJ75_08220, partial [Actinomycetota bacterium]